MTEKLTLIFSTFTGYVSFKHKDMVWSPLFGLHWEMKGHWSRVNLWEALHERTLVACKSLRSASRFTRFTRDQCPFISQCKHKSVIQSLNKRRTIQNIAVTIIAHVLWWFLPTWIKCRFVFADLGCQVVFQIIRDLNHFFPITSGVNVCH